MTLVTGKVEPVREKLIVMVFTRSIGQINFTTFNTKEEIVEALIPGRKMVYVQGVDVNGAMMDHWFELEGPEVATYDIRLLAIRAEGKIIQARLEPKLVGN